MGAAAQLSMPLTEELSWAELQARFPYQYVALLMEDENPSFDIRNVRGRVVSYGKRPTEVVKASMSWHGPEVIVGLFYTGVGMPDEDRDALRADG